MTAPLALPSGERPKPRNLLNLGVLVVVIGGVALFTTLVAAYITVGHLAKAWPPSGVYLDVYTGNMLALTAMMSAVTVEWSYYAVKHDDPAQGTWGLLITAGLGAGFVLLLWQLGSHMGFGPGSAKIGAFAVLFFAMLAASGAVALAGILAVLAVVARVIGRQATASNAEMVRAVAWYWDFVVVAWLVVYAAIWLFTGVR
ncbi:MAG TPA: cytochrome c oxidase subunit 3 [Acidimicrobiales bacterium]|nr:cytochrome c oxidase subunit 3 [Acidimicrobiales bacterium]